MHIKIKKGIRMLFAFAPALLISTASADPWIPAAGTGKVKPILRLYRSDRVFSSSHFGSETYPSTSKTSETQLKVTGEHGLGDGWALQYDLRAAQERKTKTKKNISTTSTSSGLQDQEIGLVRGLRQGETFADAFALNIILPTGSVSSNPQLGVGHTAIEPDYLFGIKRRFGQRLAYGSFSIGPRMFFNSSVTQWRATADVGTRLFRHVDIFGSLFYARTFGVNSALPASENPNASEFYNLLRGGLGLRFTLTKNIRPIIEYESDLAGQGIHAGNRWVFGLSWRY
ncbi:MAG: hypothetical protein ACYCY1_05580 [Sulfuriferula sp.]